MNPILQAALGSILRHFLTMASTYLVARGIWTEEEASSYVVAAAMAVLGIAWALYQKYATHLKIEKALQAPAGTTLEELNGTPK